MNSYRLILSAFVLMTLGLQVRLWTGEGSLAHVSGLEAIVERQAADNNRKRQRNQVLKAEIMDLRNGLDAVEEKARSELGLIKKGETFYLLVEE